MKKAYITIMLVLSYFVFPSANAATYMIEVENDEFSPTILIVNVGDTLVWVWDEGIHTSTSTLIPAGADPWSYQIDQQQTIGIYIVTVPGSYDYQCNYHASMGMLGHFTANSTTNISETQNKPVVLSNLLNESMVINFPVAGKYSIDLIALTGKRVKTIEHNAMGLSTESFSIEGLSKGIYVLNISDGRKTFSTRVIVG